MIKSNTFRTSRALASFMNDEGLTKDNVINTLIKDGEYVLIYTQE